MNFKNIILNPNWVIGFVDAEGCFRISIIKNKNIKGKALPLSVRLYFQIGLHRKDEAILELIASELGPSSRRDDGVEKNLRSSIFNSTSWVTINFDREYT
jgi:hypothetical protein